MSFCSKCGNDLSEGTLFCPKCGAHTGEQSNQNINVKPPQFKEYDEPQNYQKQQSYQTQFVSQNKPHIDTTGLVIWTAVNLLFFWPLAIYSFIIIGKINKEATQQEAQNIYDKAKTICTINSGIGVLFIVIAMAIS